MGSNTHTTVSALGETIISRPCKVGITGGIGSGKTTVCQLFQKLGVPLIDADKIAKELSRPGHEAYEQIIRTFGDQVLTHSGTLDREKMRTLIFSDPQSKQKLESILHPLVYQEIEQRSSESTSPYILISIPLLIETGGEKYIDRLLVVDCDRNLQIERVMTRDKNDRNLIEKIIDSQISRQERLTRADDVIQNNSDLQNLELQVMSLHKQYMDSGKNL